ncbi:MAG: leucine-rich repeat protein [Verrucomicrobiia bacterium]
MRTELQRTMNTFNGTALLTVIAGLLCLVGPAAQAGPLLQQYFPLQSGDQKVFTATIDNSAVQETQTFTNATFDGNDVLAASVTDTYFGGSNVTVYVNYSGDQLLWYGASRIASAGLEGGTLTFDPPVVLFDEQSLTNSATHKSSSTATTTRDGSSYSSYPVSYSYSMTSAGTVTVSAGTFSNCVKLVFKATVKTKSGSKSMTVTNLVLAPDVGIIQEPIGYPYRSTDQVGLYQLSSWSITLPYTYTTNNNAISITGYDCSDSDVTIPNLIGALPVTSIGFNAFSDCTNLTSVTIPASVTDIGSNAFYNCTSLTAVYFQGNAPTLGSPSVFATATGYDPATAYYLPGATGFGTTFGGLPTALFTSSSCTYTLSATNVTLAAKGGLKNVSVKVKGSKCSWTASTTNTWITITSGSDYTGNGEVDYTVPSNTNNTPLTGTMTIADQTVTVIQAEGGCTYKLSPKAGKIKANGGTGTVKVTPNFSDCDWTASTTNSWITIRNGTNVTGQGSFTYTVPTNTSTNVLTGTITIAGEAFTVTQSATE